MPQKGNMTGWKEEEGEEWESFCGSWEQQASATGIVPLVIPGFPRPRQEVDQAGWETWWGRERKRIKEEGKEVGRERQAETTEKTTFKILALSWVEKMWNVFSFIYYNMWFVYRYSSERNVVCIIISVCAYGWLYMCLWVCMRASWVLTGIKIWKKARLWLAVAQARCDELKVLLTFK